MIVIVMADCGFDGFHNFISFIVCSLYEIVPPSSDRLFFYLQLWTDIQARCGNIGKFSLSRRIRTFNILYVHPEIAARSLDVFEKHDFNILQTVSPGAALFYSWVSRGATRRGGGGAGGKWGRGGM